MMLMHDDEVDCSRVTICINADRNPPIALDRRNTNVKESTPSLDEDWQKKIAASNPTFLGKNFILLLEERLTDHSNDFSIDLNQMF